MVLLAVTGEPVDGAGAGAATRGAATGGVTGAGSGGADGDETGGEVGDTDEEMSVGELDAAGLGVSTVAGLEVELDCACSCPTQRHISTVAIHHARFVSKPMARPAFQAVKTGGGEVLNRLRTACGIDRSR